VASEIEASIDESIFVASGPTAAVALGVRHRLQRRRLATEVNGGRQAAMAKGGSGGDSGTCGGSGGRRLRW